MPRPAPTRVAAVVLNYGAPEETLLAVRMLERSDHPIDPLVVVDNGPDAARCRPAIEAAGVSVTLLEPGRNLGFPGGCNLGIRHALDAGAHMVLLANADLVLPPDAVGQLIDAMREQPLAGIAGPVVHCRTFPDRVRSAGIDLDPRTGRMRERRRRPREAWTGVPAVSGCAMLIDRRVFERIGLLPEEYFFSFEDLAFCHAARAAGFDIGVVRDARAYHLGGASTRPAPLTLYYGARNHLRLTASLPSHGPVHRLGRQLLVAGVNLAHALSSGGGPVWPRLGAVARGVADHARGRYGPAQ